MVPEKYRLAAVGRFLLEQFELRRPGIRQWSPQVEAALRQDAEGELQLMEKQLRELGVDDAGYWQRLRRALRVLVADGYRDAADTLALLIGSWGHDARVAYTGPGAADEASAMVSSLTFFPMRRASASFARRLFAPSDVSPIPA